jgi:hypothetical protein
MWEKKCTWKSKNSQVSPICPLLLNPQTANFQFENKIAKKLFAREMNSIFGELLIFFFQNIYELITNFTSSHFFSLNFFLSTSTWIPNYKPLKNKMPNS